MRIGLTLALLVAAAFTWAPVAWAADEAQVGQPAPSLDGLTWIHAPEGTNWEDLRGKVVLLVFDGALDISDPADVTRWNDLRAGYVDRGLRVVAVLSKDLEGKVTPLESCIAVGKLAGYEGLRLALIDAKGLVAWTSAENVVDERVLAKALKKARPFRLKPLPEALDAAVKAFRKGNLVAARDLAQQVDSDDAKYLLGRIDAYVAYWARQADGAEKRKDFAGAVDSLTCLARHFKGTPKSEDASVTLQKLKKDKVAARDIAAGKAYVKLRADAVKAEGNTKKIAALVKKAERMLGKYEDTYSGARIDRLVTAIRADPAITALRAFMAREKIRTSSPRWRLTLPRPPHVQFDPKKKYLWLIETNLGSIRIRFSPEVAPFHVANAIYLTELGFYDGLKFHRVIPGFMAQGGCPTGSGSHGPGYQFSGEFDGKTKHDGPGVLSAAHSGPGTDGSQFFITFGPAHHLDGKHTIYGQVEKGFDTLKKMEKLGTQGGQPTGDMQIESATIVVK